MHYTRLGQTGLVVSRICLGMMSFGTSEWRPYILNEDDSRPIIQRAVELGINFFDTADVYSLGVSEEVTGRALKDFTRRDEIVIATKVGLKVGDAQNKRGLSRKHIMESIDASLQRLGTDYVDLYQIHRWDYETPIEETLEALNDVVRAGKALYIGASSMHTWQFVQAVYISKMHGWSHFTCMQPHYNLVYREEERELLPFCHEMGIGVIPWSPLARGFLTGNRKRDGGGETVRSQNDPIADSLYYQEADFDVVERVVELAAQKEVKPAQIALAWVLHQNAITAPIIGTSKMYQLEEAVAAVEIELSEEDLTFLTEPYRPKSAMGHN